MMMALVMCCVTSCKDDDEEGFPSEFVGEWSIVETKGWDIYGNPYTHPHTKGDDILVLEADGTAYPIEKESDGSIWNGKEEGDFYAWKAGNGKFMIDYNDGDGWITYTVNEISSNRMVLEFVDETGEFDGEHTIETYERM